MARLVQPGYMPAPDTPYPPSPVFDEAAEALRAFSAQSDPQLPRSVVRAVALQLRIDPFATLEAGPGDALNPLDATDPRHAASEAKRLAKLLAPRAPTGEHDPFWRASAEDILAAALAWTIADRTGAGRTVSEAVELGTLEQPRSAAVSLRVHRGLGAHELPAADEPRARTLTVAAGAVASSQLDGAPGTPALGPVLGVVFGVPTGEPTRCVTTRCSSSAAASTTWGSIRSSRPGSGVGRRATRRRPGCAGRSPGVFAPSDAAPRPGRCGSRRTNGGSEWVGNVRMNRPGGPDAAPICTARASSSGTRTCEAARRSCNSNASSLPDHGPALKDEILRERWSMQPPRRETWRTVEAPRGGEPPKAHLLAPGTQEGRPTPSTTKEPSDERRSNSSRRPPGRR